MSSEILSLRAPVGYDDRIISIQDHAYNPYTTAYGHNDEIRIVIQNQDLYVLLHRSYIYIEGAVTVTVPADAATAAERQAPNFSNNAACFLFNEIRYELNGFPIDICKNVGITSTMKGYLSYTPKESNRLEISSWKKESSIASTNG